MEKCVDTITDTNLAWFSTFTIGGRVLSSVQVNCYGNRRRIHLHRQPRVTKKRGLVEYYSLATCLFEDGKNQKKIILGLGELSKQDAEQYRLLLRAINGQLPPDLVTDIESIVFGDERQYLDVLAMNALWCKLGLHKVFTSEREHGQRLSTENVARILTINRLLQPSSKVRSVEWFSQTLLATIMEIDQGAYDRNKIFRELVTIHGTKDKLERLFWEYSQRHRRNYDVYYFDGSTSWFEGNKCPLADADIEKTRGHFSKVIGLMLITDNEGFPVAWEVVNGHTRDTTELKAFVDRITKKFGIEEITYCFDRGVASDSNFSLITSCRSKYISAIKDNQIKKVFNLDKFKATRVKITDKICDDETTEHIATPSRRRIIDIDGFCSSDGNIFFKDLGLVQDRRYIASFNYELFTNEYHERQARIERALKEIAEKNEELRDAKGDRDYNSTERDLLDILGKHRVRTYFNYKLLPLTSTGEKKAQTFKIECEINRSKIIQDELSDGLLIYITNHVEMRNKHDFKVTAADIIQHYKGKYVVENAFRELKSFLELRPIYVWTEAHVKAHYDISIVACFINNYINVKIKELDQSLRDFHAHLTKAGRVAQLVAPSGINLFKLKKITEETRRYFECLDINDTLSPSIHRSHGVCP